MFKLSFLTVSLLIANAAQADDILVKLNCQKSLADGHILVANTHTLPAGSKYKVMSFTQTESANGWATGQCLLDVTPKASSR